MLFHPVFISAFPQALYLFNTNPALTFIVFLQPPYNFFGGLGFQDLTVEGGGSCGLIAAPYTAFGYVYSNNNQYEVMFSAMLTDVPS